MSPVYVPSGYTPLSTFIKVDLPAPFSPTRQWISPCATRKLTLFSAFTPGNSLVMSRISRMGVFIANLAFSYGTVLLCRSFFRSEGRKNDLQEYETGLTQ